MKKVFVLPVLLCLCACDNNTIVGKCLTNRTSTTTTEQDRQVVETKVTNFLLCGCFKDSKSKDPAFMIPEEEFVFKAEGSEVQKSDKITCDKQCKKSCETHLSF